MYSTATRISEGTFITALFVMNELTEHDKEGKTRVQRLPNDSRRSWPWAGYKITEKPKGPSTGSPCPLTTASVPEGTGTYEERPMLTKGEAFRLDEA